MRNGVLILAGLVLLCACTPRLPGSNLGARRPPPPAAVPVVAAPEPQAILPLRRAELEPGLRGAILRVEAVAPTLGWYDATLVPVETPPEPGVRGFELRASAPEAPLAVGSERSRLLSAATFLPAAELAGLRQVRVNGTTLAVPARR